MPHLTRIAVFPVKSLDGIELNEVDLLPSGALRDDRRYALLDSNGDVFNAKRTALFHPIRSGFDFETQTLTLGTASGPRLSFRLGERAGRDGASSWLSEQLEEPVHFVENAESGFPDDTELPGPTVIATATLETVASWFPGLDLPQTRRRFRANLEIAGTEPFWDDRLFAAPGVPVRFRVGEVVLHGMNPCARCPVPSRSPDDGTPIRLFSKELSARRRASLPGWADSSRFDHHYRLAVNTRLAENRGGRVRVGEPVEILAPTGE
jgi:uncharacterized protein YcbX